MIMLLVVGVGYVFLLTDSGTITNYPSGGTTIVAFGDSLVAGVGATSGNDLVSQLNDRIGEPIVNLGVSGDTTADALARIDSVVEQNPKVVLVLLGGNDYLQNVPPEETFANLETIIETIHAAGSSVVLLGVRGGVLRDNFKSEFADLANKHNTAYVSDVLNGVFGNPQLMHDPIHPNDAGYEIIADRVEPVLRDVLPE